jgi:hypothetical protein
MRRGTKHIEVKFCIFIILNIGTELFSLKTEIIYEVKVLIKIKI